MHARLLVSKYQECFHFYRDIMGFKVERGDEHAGYAEFVQGNFKMALFGRRMMARALNKADLPYESDCQDRVCLVLEVNDVDKAFHQFKSKGVNFEFEPIDRPSWEVRTAHFRDPCGNLIEINSLLPESDQAKEKKS